MASPAGPDSDEKIRLVQSEIGIVTNVMKQNIEKVMDNTEKLNQIQNKTEDLESNARLFGQKTKELRKAMWWKNMKIKLMIIGIILLLILIIVLATHPWTK